MRNILDTVPTMLQQIGEDSATPGRVRITYLVKRLELAVRSRLDKATAAHGLTTPQCAALSVLRLRSGLSSAELARRSFASAQAMNEMVAAMEKKGMIERHTSADHRKIRKIFLTLHGQDVLSMCDVTVDEVERQMLSTIIEDEIISLGRILQSCAGALTPEQILCLGLSKRNYC